MAFFSVIIPLYNKENFIESTLKSVLNQTFTDFEVIIINDCSTDRSLDVVQKSWHPKVRILEHKKNQGLSASRNTGIKNANGNYLAFLDADDLWKENYLEKIYFLITTFPEAKLYATNYQEIFSNQSLLPENNSQKLPTNSIIDDFFGISLAQPLYCPSSLCVEQSVFKQIGYYNENITFGEDIDFNIRANTVFKLAYSKEPLVDYLTSSENQITASSLKHKTITDFDFYETEFKNSTLKKYLDFNRYIMCKHYKAEGDIENVKKMKNAINLSNLNYKQIILLNSPRFILTLIKKIKQLALQKGVKLTTYY